MFEFDLVKSKANLRKHGIDFADAQALWLDYNCVEGPASPADEARRMVVGQIDRKLWSAVITYRGANIRLISVRRSRPKEAEAYENQKN